MDADGRLPDPEDRADLVRRPLVQIEQHRSGSLLVAELLQSSHQLEHLRAVVFIGYRELVERDVATSRSELFRRDAEADAPDPVRGMFDAFRGGESARERLRGRIVRDLAAPGVREEGPPESLTHLLVQLLD